MMNDWQRPMAEIRSTKMEYDGLQIVGWCYVICWMHWHLKIWGNYQDWLPAERIIFWVLIKGIDKDCYKDCEGPNRWLGYSLLCCQGCTIYINIYYIISIFAKMRYFLGNKYFLAEIYFKEGSFAMSHDTCQEMFMREANGDILLIIQHFFREYRLSRRLLLNISLNCIFIPPRIWMIIIIFYSLLRAVHIPVLVAENWKKIIHWLNCKISHTYLLLYPLAVRLTFLDFFQAFLLFIYPPILTTSVSYSLLYITLLYILLPTWSYSREESDLTLLPRYVVHFIIL